MPLSRKLNTDSASETTLEVDDVAAQLALKSKKKAKLHADGEGASEDKTLMSNYRISEDSLKILKEKNIESFFPIQYETYDLIYDGNDVVGRARTGTGKTLSFALPVVERLIAKGRLKNGAKGGSVPRVLCLLPTRELAQQVAREFQMLEQGKRFQTICIYGGVPDGQQVMALRKGVDVVIGTPGRTMDMLQRGCLLLDKLSVVILDEADQMLEMGFREDVEAILAQVGVSGGGSEDEPTKKTQYLLFTATLPAWVSSIAQKFMSPNKKVIDVVKGSVAQSAIGIRHLIMRCDYFNRSSVLSDVFSMYTGMSGSCIIFTETKAQANEISLSSSVASMCQVLHGDIPQSQRETTLRSFREGKFRCLVATDVAARGLHVDKIDLVVQFIPPKDVDTYVHRAGRTGRAGASGVCITFCNPSDYPFMGAIEKHIGTKMERVGIPQPDVRLSAQAMSLTESLKSMKVASDLLAKFIPAAEALIAETGAVDAICRCLCEMSGYSKQKATDTRSILTGKSGAKAFEIVYNKTEIRALGYVWKSLKGTFPGKEELVDKINSMTMRSDCKGAVFDVNSEDIEEFETAVKGICKKQKEFFVISELKELPELASISNGDGEVSTSHRNPNHRWNSGRARGGGGGGGRGGGGGYHDSGFKRQYSDSRQQHSGASMNKRPRF